MGGPPAFSPNRRGPSSRFQEGGTGCRLSLSAFRSASDRNFGPNEPAMPAPEHVPSETFRESCIPVLETARLILRAPRLGDAKVIAALANDRHLAEHTARIPHPSRLA